MPNPATAATTATAAAIEVDRIGFDFDGVIADTAEAFIRLACRQYDYCSYALEDITSFQVEDCLDIPQSLVDRIFHAILEDSLATELRPMAGAVRVIHEMASLGPVTIVTARPLARPVEDWLDHHLAPDACRKIRLIAMGDHDDKARHINELGLSHFVDDRAETCHQLDAAAITPLVFDQPWNRGRHRFQAVTGWSEIHTLLDLPLEPDQEHTP